MPTLEGYEHADTPHGKTIAVKGSVYGCHSSRNGDEPRGRTTTYPVQRGWTPDGRRLMVMHAYEGAPMACGHNFNDIDVECEGCSRRLS